MKKLFIYLPMLILGMMLLLVSDLYPEVPKIINYQAKLIDAEGKVVDGVQTIKFAVYDNENGVNVLWQESQNCNAKHGFINVYLGAVNPIELDFNIPYWLEVSIGSAAPYDRVKLSTVPYAFYAATADSAGVSALALSAETVSDGTITAAKLAPGENIGDILVWNGEQWILSPKSSGAGGAFATSSGVTSNSVGLTATDDFVFGSSQLNDDANSDHTFRFFFDKSLGAFRAGRADKSQWDESNIGNYSFASGANTIASEYSSTALGHGTVAEGKYSLATGLGSRAEANNSTAFGTSTLASAVYATSMGRLTKAEGHASTSMGFNTTASGAVSTAMGFATIASGDTSTAMGSYTVANGVISTAMGCETVASGKYSTATGRKTLASGYNSTATGYYTKAIGDYSTAMGYSANADGRFSTALCAFTYANGKNSIATGSYNVAEGENTTAMGLGNKSESLAQMNVGIYSTHHYLTGNPDYWVGTDRLFVVGNGRDYDERSDAMIIYKNGNTTINGDLHVIGSVSKSGGSFKIDHPQDPFNKYLCHSFVESPDMMNIYNGNVVTDGESNATIQLPDYFESLNMDFRYQLTVIGQFAQAIISQKIKDNKFSIKTDKPNVEVSWQITGIRNDKYAKGNRIVPEVDKEPDMRGKLLYNP